MFINKRFQFHIRSILALIFCLGIGLAVSQSVSIGVQVCFFVALCMFWVGLAFIAAVADTRRWSFESILVLLIGQAVVVTSSCVCLACLALIMRAWLDFDTRF